MRRCCSKLDVFHSGLSCVCLVNIHYESLNKIAPTCVVLTGLFRESETIQSWIGPPRSTCFFQLDLYIYRIPKSVSQTVSKSEFYRMCHTQVCKVYPYNTEALVNTSEDFENIQFFT
jgi:hypothetical protein